MTSARLYAVKDGIKPPMSRPSADGGSPNERPSPSEGIRGGV